MVKRKQTKHYRAALAAYKAKFGPVRKGAGRRRLRRDRTKTARVVSVATFRRMKRKAARRVDMRRFDTRRRR